MTKTKLLPLLVIVAVAAMMGAASIAPAYAAQKITNTHEITEDFIDNVAVPICGAAVGVDLFVQVNMFTKEWDNGHFKIHINSHFNVYDDITGELVGTIPGNAINFQGKDALPISLNVNSGGEGACTDGSPLQFESASHCGVTIQRSGNTIVHSVACDFD